MMTTNARSKAVLVLALALAGFAGERVAEACDPTGLSGASCANPMPICVTTSIVPLAGKCEACSDTVAANACPAGLTCVTDNGPLTGSCVATCTTSYVDGGPDAGACTASTPVCLDSYCRECHPGMGHDPSCNPDTPDCNDQGYCGCLGGTTSCPELTHCVTGAGTYGFGACVSTCTTMHDCNGSGVCVYNGDIDDGQSDAGSCVTCFGDAGCSPTQVCDSETFVCVAAPDSGVTSGDGGSTGPGSDAGDGGTVGGDGGGSLRDATVGGDGGGDDDDGGETGNGDIYRYGKVEGGGCSLLAGGAGVASGTGGLFGVFGFAGLAGLLFMRRAQRRSERRRDGRR